MEISSHKEKHNKVGDALRRLCMQFCLHTHKYVNIATSASIRKTQLEKEDPMVMKTADEGTLDIPYPILPVLTSYQND